MHHVGGDDLEPAAKLELDYALDDEIARALVYKHNPVIEAIRAEDRAQGKAEGVCRGKAETLVAILAARGALDPAQRDRILAEREVARLERWIDPGARRRFRRRAARRIVSVVDRQAGRAPCS
jgi:hypothetical protein